MTFRATPIFRVDFIDGESVFGKPRFTDEYLPDEVSEARALIDEFFRRSPEPFQYLSGGADVARLEDGTWRIIEFNTGGNSGTMQPGVWPIDSNLYTSQLLGEPTPLIRDLERKFAADLETQRAHLKSMKQEKELWDKNSLADLSLAELARWYRDRYLDEWRKAPTAENARLTLQRLEQLFREQGSPGNSDLPRLLEGARNHLNLKTKQPKP